MRKYYSDLVRHCTRFYFSKESAPSALTSRADYNNYISVANVLDKYSLEEKLILKQVYQSESTIRAVNAIRNEKWNTESIWYLIQKYEREVAMERGIL